MDASTTLPPDSGSGTVLSGEMARAWLRELVDAETLTPCRALLTSAHMIAESITLGKRGFGVIVADPDREALNRLVREARSRNVKDVQTVEGDIFSRRPMVFGRVDCVVEREFLPTLAPIQRAEWAHHVSRLLPRHGELVGLFRVGTGGPGAERAVPEADLKKLLRRHFTEEIWTEIDAVEPGGDRVMRGLFRRK